MASDATENGTGFAYAGNSKEVEYERRETKEKTIEE